MTDQPPSPPGNYPPAPPPPGGYPPPPPPQGGGYPPPPQATTAYPSPPAAAGPSLPPEAYTPWFTRVLAWIIDYIPVTIIVGIGFAVLAGTRETACITDMSEYDLGEFCSTDASTLGQVSALGIAPIIALAYVIWNLGYRQGQTGSSIGKTIMKFKVISEKTGQPLGFGMSFVREIVYLVAYFGCGILWLVAVLFPLWDPKRQTLVDKIVSSICLPL
ncbi:MAG: hypothetical protein QOI29_2136 [Mycobacterium sp.]|jgi:uncharacterized RDD family membrane protein YckC|nr:hypothetical protein [Mycobacterium sp.]